VGNHEKNAKNYPVLYTKNVWNIITKQLLLFNLFNSKKHHQMNIHIF
jgi:hypothetical protein